MPTYNIIEYIDNYSKTSGSLFQYYRVKSALETIHNAIADVADNNTTDSFKFKEKITGQTDNNRTKNCEINIMLTWSVNCVIPSNAVAYQVTTFLITNTTKLYVPVVKLSTQDNAKLLHQLKSGFKRTTDWNKYQSEVSAQAQNQHLDYLIYPSFQGLNRLFVLSFKNDAHQTSHTRYFLSTL